MPKTTATFLASPARSRTPFRETYHWTTAAYSYYTSS